jgi:hypothetical protein
VFAWETSEFKFSDFDGIATLVTYRQAQLHFVVNGVATSCVATKGVAEPGGVGIRSSNNIAPIKVRSEGTQAATKWGVALKNGLIWSFNSVVLMMCAKHAPQVPGLSALASAGGLTPPLQAGCCVSASKRVVPVSVNQATHASPLLLLASVLRASL